VQTDPGLDSSTEILNLANLLISAAGLRVRQVPFEASPLPNGDLTATPAQIQQSVHNFLHGGQPPPTRQTAAIARKVRHRGGLAGLPLTATLAANVEAENAAKAGIPFTAEFPKVQDLAGSGAYSVSPHCTTLAHACIRDYLIHAPGGEAYPIYAEVFSNGQLGQFYDVQGTTWTDAPLFGSPNQTLHVGRRTYDLYYDGSQLATVTWHEYGAWYWVHNTLTNAVDNGELLAIAEQTTPLGRVSTAAPSAPTGHPGKSTPNLRAVAVPTRRQSAPATSTVQTLGGIAGLLGLLAAPVLAGVLLRRWLKLRRLRAELAELNDRQAALLAAARAARADLAARAAAGPPPRRYEPAGPAGPRTPETLPSR
jgi:uncharacterized protein YjiS (DUF1127 family)